MANNLKLAPSAASLTESMRDLGYSLETAVADILDNSISAYATEIDIYCLLSNNNPSLAIIDNGIGMSKDELLKAMKHGSINPKAERDIDDLGRFGLGLKTASFSQCRQLTVISSRKKALNAAQWDLDLISKHDEWLLQILDESEIQSFDMIDKLPETGTLVVWKLLDRLFEEMTGKSRDALVNEKLELVERHLSLVFHRFLSGDVKKRKKLTIRINGHQVEPFDPFCRANKATQVHPEEKVMVDGKVINIQPYTLPHHSKLTKVEYDFYHDRSDFISNQGAYIYRNGRLMAWGDWFRLVPRGEATKLARVQIDFPNSLDESWTIDIKKSRARPPLAVRERMKQIISKIASSSTRVHRRRGQLLFSEVRAPFWERYSDPRCTRYSINQEHPIISSFAKELDKVKEAQFLTLLESAATSLPLEMIYSDFSMNPKEMISPIMDNAEILSKLSQLNQILNQDGKMTPKNFREIVQSTKLFEDHEELLEEFIKEELGG